MAEDLHPHPEELRGLMLGRLSQRDSRRVIRHLLPGCPRCREVTSAFWRSGEGAGEEVAGDRFRYDSAMVRVVERVRRAGAELDADRVASRRRFAALETRPAGRWRSVVRKDPRCHTWGFCEVLLERSAAPSAAPAESDLCAGMAVEVAGRIDPELHPPLLLSGLRARAWTALADSRRRLGDLRSAEEAMRQAEAHLVRGTGDRLEKAWLLERKALLRTAQERPEEAARLFSRAVLLYRRTGQWEDAGRVLLSLGCVRVAAGDMEGALPALRRGLELSGPGRAAGLLWFLSRLGRRLSAPLRR